MGKIDHDQHVPAIAGNPAFELVATVSRSPNGVEGVPHFHDIADLIASGQGIDAVALCTPPQVRRAIAMQAIQAGWHVFLEKPPGATLAEVANLEAASQAAGVTLFASWHVIMNCHALNSAISTGWNRLNAKFSFTALR